MSLDVLFFEIRGRRCALPVADVREVAGVPPVTPVPLTPPVVCGVAALGGQAMPLLDLGVWMGGGAEVAPSLLRAAGPRVLVIEARMNGEPKPVRAALAVDRVSRIGTIEETHAKAAPEGATYVAATVLDVEGPALLIDAAAVMAEVKRSGEARGRS